MGGQEGISSPSCVPKQVWKLLARRLLEKRGRCAAERKFRLKSLTIGEHALTNVSDFTEDVPIYCEVTMLYLLLTVIGFILKPISLLHLIRCTRGRVVRGNGLGGGRTPSFRMVQGSIPARVQFPVRDSWVHHSKFANWLWNRSQTCRPSHNSQ